MSTLLISDLHLDPGRPHVAVALEGLLAARAQADTTLYILGDLFEAWLGDDDDTEINRRIVAALAQASERGAALYLMHGNRDFLLGEAFCAATGARLLEDPAVIAIEGRRVLLLHGDSLCTRDLAYMEARKTLRDPAFQRDFLARTLEDRATFAANARAESMAHTSTTAMAIMDVTPEEVVAVMRTHDVDLLVHGHTHRPRVHQLQVDGRDALRIVLGDWAESGWLLEFDAAGYHLFSFPIAAGTGAAS